MNITLAAENLLKHISDYLHHLSDEQYTKIDGDLNASVGQHTRHVIEFFQVLFAQADSGIVNYDKRMRNTLIEENTAYAANQLEEIIERLRRRPENFPIKLEVNYDLDCEECNYVDSTFEREIIYTIEHTVHHMALIRIGIKAIAPEYILAPDFGIAASTLRHKHVHRNLSSS